MTLCNLCKELSISDEQFVIPENLFRESQQINSNALPDYWKNEFIIQNYKLIDGPNEALPLLLQCAEQLSKNPAIVAYGKFLHYAMYLAPEQYKCNKFPHLNHLIGEEQAGMFQLIIAMSAMPLIHKSYRELQLPDKYFHDAVAWLGGTIKLYQLAHPGLCGHNLSQSYWLRNYIDKKLFRIGRLEFMLELETPKYLPIMLQRKSDHRLLALAQDGWRYYPNGIRALKDTPDEKSFICHSDNNFSGIPITADGNAHLAVNLSVNANEWEQLPQAGKNIAAVHIPAGSALSPEIIQKSMLDAVNFFKNYLHRDIQLFCCHSWLFNPEISKKFPHGSLASWRRCGYATGDIENNGRCGFFFIYGDAKADAINIPPQNSMQQHCHDVMVANGEFRGSCMIWLTERLQDFTSSSYAAEKNLP